MNLPPIAKKILPVSKVLPALPKDDDVWARVKPVALDWSTVKLKVVLYGESGSGKTTIWSSFPKPILVILCSGGKKKADELWSICDGENDDDIHEVNLLSSVEMGSITSKAEGTPFKTIVVDHLSGFQDLVLKGIIGNDVPQQKFWGLAQQQEWGQVSYQMKELLAPMLDLDMNVVWIAHERSFEPKKALEGGRAIIAADAQVAKAFIGPALTPGVADWVNGAVNFVLQTYKTEKRVMTKVTMGEGDNIMEQEVEEVKRGADYWIRMEASNIYRSKIRLPRKWLDRLHDIKVGVKDSPYELIMRMIQGKL